MIIFYTVCIYLTWAVLIPLSLLGYFMFITHLFGMDVPLSEHYRRQFEVKK